MPMPTRGFVWHTISKVQIPLDPSRHVTTRYLAHAFSGIWKSENMQCGYETIRQIQSSTFDTLNMSFDTTKTLCTAKIPGVRFWKILRNLSSQIRHNQVMTHFASFRKILWWFYDIELWQSYDRKFV